MFTLTQKFKGFRTKTDPTKLRSGYLVDGSQNVLSTDSENIKIRGGYTQDGTASTDNEPITSAYDWETHNGYTRILRCFDDTSNDGTIEYRYGGEWYELENSYTNSTFQFTIYWDTNEQIDMLLYCNGTTSVYAWSGAIAEISETTANTIKKTGTTSWTEERFVTDGSDYDKKVVINGTTYTYTGGEGTTTLTGVTPDPSSEADGSIVVQKPTAFADLVGSGYDIDLISTFRNQVYYGSLDHREVYISVVGDFNDVSTQSSPRLPGQYASITLDDVPRGFVPQEDNIYISAGTSQWYNIVFTLSSDLTSETVSISRLKSGIGEGSYSQDAITRMKNRIVYLSNEPTIDTLGRVENVDTPQAVPISDPIKPTLEGYDRDNASLTYFQNNIYVAVPGESIVLIYNVERGYWEAPQTLAISRFSIIDNELYGHSSLSKNTYKLFTGHNDADNPIDAKAKFSYMSFGDRTVLKNFDEFFSEGYISSNTTLNLNIYYDYQGYEGISSYEIDGGDEDVTLGKSGDNSLGKNSLGKEPLGGTTEASDELAKFKQINTMPKKDFFEMQIEYTSNEVDDNWEILAFGGNITKSNNKPINITK
ncbi:MAG: hypothetical protein U9O94_03585 [Nanoarchaeota archaeon]|nr:hypothetical protein [Nanoarchaeota archaeon]